MTLQTNAASITLHNLLAAWQREVNNATQLLESLSDEQCLRHIAPGKNTGRYLFGHLVAVHDGMQSLLGLGDRLYAHWDEPFIRKPDGAAAGYPSMEEVRAAWQSVHSRLHHAFEALTPDAWMARHTAVSEEDFAQQPHRNRLNVLISRTAHLAYHTGQLALLRP